MAKKSLALKNLGEYSLTHLVILGIEFCSASISCCIISLYYCIYQ